MKHPEAQDTAEGIALWWLQSRDVAAVTEAITELGTAGWVEVRIGPDGKRHYRLNRARWRQQLPESDASRNATSDLGLSH